MVCEYTIQASILACDFNFLSDQVCLAQRAGVDGFHLDIMDGHFVPNLSMGPQIVSSVRRITSLPLDVHLMLYNPFDYIEKFVESGAHSITFHLEATEGVHECIEYIRKCGVRVGIALSPQTSVSMVTSVLGLVDRLLLMTVEPGFGGQTFIEESIEKIRLAKDLIRASGAQVDLQVDGGIDSETAKRCRAVGATSFVAGTSLYGAKDFGVALHKMKASIEEISYGNE